ncbi:MAG: SusC/RagA family TonB-linked outer membrane protein [Bacteroidales bacterium]|nr:SusC/RagA family TonB-linked outer membrane protein [Bacteroidales bacterium]MDT8374176.1 SusC/RagA family TonB-linked outer membrane protein [Bacteroidales bacterium]
MTGTVTDATTNETLPGVNVIIKNTTTGTSTDLNGFFSISVASGQVLVFTSLGYASQEMPVGASNRIDVKMSPDVEFIEEVVVVGYGTQRRANLTGAVSTVNVEKTLEARPIADAGRGLQGTMPGLSVVIPSGEIGSDPILKIRGQIGSLQGGSSPLILVDNVEIPSIQMLNPDDIESISVLKDAASSSIYGAKAAFGVILITTKKGAVNQGVNVSYNGNLSFQNISKKMEMAGLDALEYALLAFERRGATVAGAFWMVTREGYEKAVEWKENWGDVVKPDDPMLYGRDWYVDANNRKIGLRTYDPYYYMIEEWTPTNLHNFSLSGKAGTTDYNIGLGYLDQSGINKPAKIDDFRRYNGSIRLGTDVNDWLRVTAGAMYSKRNKRYAYATRSTSADPWLYLYRWAPTYPLTTEDGDPIRSPVYEMSAANTAFIEHNYTSVNGGFVITPVKDWKINFDYTHANMEYITKRPGTRYTARNSWTAAVAKNDENGDRIYVDNTGQVVPSTAPGAMPAYQLSMMTYTGVGSNPDHVYRRSQNDQRNTLNLYTTYDWKMMDDHQFRFMTGMNRVAYEYAYNWSQTTQLIDYNNPQFDLAYGTQTTSGGEYWESQLGFYGRVNYNFREKYLFEANLRYDGTSKFPTDLQWRLFPSFSAGWIATEEQFMDWARPALSLLKFRGSWGTIGDQTVSNSLYIPTMGGSQNNWLLGGAKMYQFATPGAVSASVTWQDITTLNLGFDARFLSNKLGLTFDWFRRDTRNMIVPQEGLPTTFGTRAPQSNFGSLRTNGMEIQVDYNHRFENGLGITLTATLADAVSKITEYGSTKSIDSWYVGKTYGEIWGYETDRLFQAEDFAYDNEGNLIKIQVPNETGSADYTIYQLADPANVAIQGRLQAGNFYFMPGDVKFVDQNDDGYINPGNRLIEDADGNPDYGDLKIIGNSTPRWMYGFRADLDFRGVDLSFFIQGVGKREVWGNGFLAIPGYYSANGAMPQAFAGDFWREDRTDAFYPRPYDQSGSSTTLNMQPQTRYLLNMAYTRLKNITLGYTLPTSLTRKVMISRLRVYVALENFFTFDHLGTIPIDPEEIQGYSMWRSSYYNMNRTGVGVPTFKSASVGIQVKF